MTSQEFNKIVEEFLNKTKDVLMKKEDEYSLTDDRFKFFKTYANIAGITPEKALYYCMLKHFVSITDMINSGKTYPKQLFFDKLGDAVNYLILLYGLLKDDGMFSDISEHPSYAVGQSQPKMYKEPKLAMPDYINGTKICFDNNGIKLCSDDNSAAPIFGKELDKTIEKSIKKAIGKQPKKGKKK